MQKYTVRSKTSVRTVVLNIISKTNPELVTYLRVNKVSVRSPNQAIKNRTRGNVRFLVTFNGLRTGFLHGKQQTRQMTVRFFGDLAQG